MICIGITFFNGISSFWASFVTTFACVLITLVKRLCFAAQGAVTADATEPSAPGTVLTALATDSVSKRGAEGDVDPASANKTKKKKSNDADPASGTEGNADPASVNKTKKKKSNNTDPASDVDGNADPARLMKEKKKNDANPASNVKTKTVKNNDTDNVMSILLLPTKPRIKIIIILILSLHLTSKLLLLLHPTKVKSKRGAKSQQHHRLDMKQ